MSVISNNQLAGASGQGGSGYEIKRSLRIDDVSNATLTRTPSTSGNRKTWSLSFWIKRTEIGGAQLLFNAGNTSNGDHSVMRFNGDMFQMYQYGHSGDTTAWSGGNGSQLRTSAKFRDPSAWMHIVVAMDTTQATASDRLKYYINGVLQTEFDSTSYPAQNSNPGYWNADDLQCWGGQVQNSSPSGSSDYYLAEVHMVDGQQLAASDFGEYDDNNVWQPKKFEGSHNTDGYTVSGGPYYATSTTWAHALNGSTTGRVMTYSSTSTTATFSPGISWSSQVRIYGIQYGGGYAKVNGGSNLTGFSTTAGWVDVTSQVGSSGTLTSLTVGDVGTNYFGLYAIELDGTILNVSEAGVNGFHLDFSDNSSNAALGNDAAGSNNWTVNNLSVASGAGNDSLIDTPTNYTSASGNNGGNYATLNPLSIIQTVSGDTSKPTFSNGNLTYDGVSSKWGPGFGSIAIPSSGKWYFEATLASTTVNAVVGIAKYLYATGNRFWDQGTGTQTLFKSAGGAIKYKNTSQASGTALSAYDTVGVAINCDDDEVKFYRNGSLEATVSTPSNVVTAIDNGEAFPFVDSYNGIDWYLNFGQRPFSNSNIPTGHLSLCTTNLPDPTIADGSTAFDATTWTGTGTSQTITGLKFNPDFLWVKNRSSATSNYVTDTVRGITKYSITEQNSQEGTNSNRITAVTSDGFSLGTHNGFNENNKAYVGWTWDAGSSNTSITAGSLNSSVYDQSQTWSSYLSGDNVTDAANAFDGSTSTIAQSPNSASAYLMLTYTFTNVTSLRVYASNPTNNEMRLNNTGSYTAESSLGASSNAGWRDLTSLIPSNGTVTHIEAQNSGSNGVNWAAIEVNGRLLINSGVSVTSVPSVASTVRANQTAGFSIVSYTGTGSDATVGHGLNAQPYMVVIKDRSAANAWAVQHVGATLGSGLLKLNSQDAVSTGVADPVWNSTAPTSSVFSVGTSNDTNGSGNTYIAYCFAPVEGYSAFGSYTGNGSSDGPFVFTGFRPRWIMIKRITDGAENWRIVDTARDTYNLADAEIYANSNSAELDSDLCDILSNGFKIRVSFSGSNTSGKEYLYAAFAEHPFKTARAR